MTQRDLATAIHAPVRWVNEVVRGKREVTSSTAMRLALFLGTSSDFWMSLELRYDTYQAQRTEVEQMRSIWPHRVVTTL